MDKLHDRTGGDKKIQLYFPEFKISHIPKAQSGISNSLARIVRSFHSELFFIGCSIPISLPIPRHGQSGDHSGSGRFYLGFGFSGLQK